MWSGWRTNVTRQTMAYRATSGPLTESECRRVQWAYHMGTEARKRVIQKLFGREITYASCMAAVERSARRAELEGTPIAIARPAEAELWEWLCCAAFHQYIWDENVKSEVQGNVRGWVFHHCKVMGDPSWEWHNPQYDTLLVPPDIPTTLKIKVYKFCSLAIRHSAKLIGPAILIFLGFFLERIADAIFP